jgi:tetratricopeptide (TPR) repeat protein
LQNLLEHPLAPKGTTPYAKVVDLAGLLLLNLGREVEARALFEEAIGLWRDLHDQLNEARAIFHLGLAIHRQGDPATAQSLLEQALALCRSLGSPGKHETAWLLAFLGVFLSYREEFARAEELFAESIVLSREVEDLNLEAFMLRHWGFMALHMAEHDRAARHFKKSLRLNLEVKHKQGIAASLSGLGALAAEQGFATRAICLFGIVKALLDTFGSALLDADAFEYESHFSLARAALSEDQFVAAWARGQAMPLDEAIAYALEERHS